MDETDFNALAVNEAITWLEANRERLHASECSVHIPSARCSCGLHRVLTGLHSVVNGNAHMFYVTED